MKRALALALTLIMVLSMVVIGASAAPAGNAINSEADFLAMEAGGTYYLAADITVTKSYDKVFTGFFDGNGKTVTVQAPMFADFSGTIKNMTIAGELTGETNLGALALTTTKGFVAAELTNNANITVTAGTKDAGLLAGGFVAGDKTGVTNVTFYKCVNNGKVSNNNATDKVVSYAGGFMGAAGGATIAFCENNGEVVGLSNRGHVGGFIGWVCCTGSFTTMTVTDSVNNAKIYGENNVGGFFGNHSGAENTTMVPGTIKYSVNNGDIIGAYEIGGFMGLGAGTAKNPPEVYWEMYGCLNTGDIYIGQLTESTRVTYGSLLVGYGNCTFNKFENCIAIGEVKMREGSVNNIPDESKGTESYIRPVLFGCSTAKAAEYIHSKNNVLCDNGTVTWFSFSSSASYDYNRIKLADGITADSFKVVESSAIQNGSAVAALNTAAGEEVFVQSSTDLVPKINPTLAAAREAEFVKTLNLEAPGAEANTTPPETTTDEQPKDTTPSETTTDAPISDTVTTEGPADNTTTAAPTTDKPEDKGCAGVGLASASALIAAVSVAFFAIKRKKF